VHDLTVRSAVLVINTITPQAQAVAKEARIIAPGGGLNVLLRIGSSNALFPSGRHPEHGRTGAEHRARSALNLSLDAGRDLWGVGRSQGCNARTQPRRRRATLRRDTIGIRVNPEDLTASAPGERSKELPTPLDATARASNPGTSDRRRSVLVLAQGL
jgi:hypothetical protein